MLIYISSMLDAINYIYTTLPGPVKTEDMFLLINTEHEISPIKILIVTDWLFLKT